MSEIISTPNAAQLAERVGHALAGRYRIIGEPEHGGMAIVFQAIDERHDRRVAIKVLYPHLVDGGDAARFAQEIQTIAGLEHPHIVRLIDSGIADGLPYYVMPYIDGGTLRDRLNREPKLPVAEAIQIATEVASALDFAHRRGIIHRDIKPENIYLLDGSAMVGDFGIAVRPQASAARLTQHGFAVGTPQYMSPEQAVGEQDVDGRTDVWALAVVLYEMLTGEVPFTGATPQSVFTKIMTQTPTPLRLIRPVVPTAVDKAVNRAMARDPGNRFSTPSDFATALVSGKHVAAVPDLVAGSRRRKSLAIGGTVVAVLAAIAFLLSRAGDRPDTAATSAPEQLTSAGDAEMAALSPDGRMVAYLTRGRRRLVLQEINKDAPVSLLDSPTDIGPPHWSPDGTSILVRASMNGSLKLLSIPRLPGSPPASFSIPGSYFRYDYFGADSLIAVTCCGGRIYLGPDPGEVTFSAPDSFAVKRGKLLDVRKTVRRIIDFKVSPNGKRLAVIGSNDAGDVVLAVGDATGKTFEASTRVLGSSRMRFRSTWSVRWSSDGNAVWYSRESPTGTELSRISLAPAGELGIPKVVVKALPFNVWFDVGPKDSTVIYTGGPTKTRLLQVDVRTQMATELATGTAKYSSVQISPGGWAIGYVKGRAADQDIYLLYLGNKSEHRLTRSGVPVGRLSWSPDGVRIAYVIEDSGIVNVVEAGGGQIRRIATDIAPDSRPIWNPAGDSILFTNRDREFVSVSAREPGQPTVISLEPAADSAPESSIDSLVRRRPIRRLWSASVMGPGGQLAGLAYGDSGDGVGVFERATRTQRMVADGGYNPLSWPNDSSLVAVRIGNGQSDSTVIELIDPRNRTSRPFAQLPYRCQEPSVAAQLSQLICVEEETTADVWLIALPVQSGLLP